MVIFTFSSDPLPVLPTNGVKWWHQLFSGGTCFGSLLFRSITDLGDNRCQHRLSLLFCHPSGILPDFRRGLTLVNPHVSSFYAGA